MTSSCSCKISSLYPLPSLYSKAFYHAINTNFSARTCGYSVLVIYLSFFDVNSSRLPHFSPIFLFCFLNYLFYRSGWTIYLAWWMDGCLHWINGRKCRSWWSCDGILLGPAKSTVGSFFTCSFFFFKNKVVIMTDSLLLPPIFLYLCPMNVAMGPHLSGDACKESFITAAHLLIWSHPTPSL